MGRHIYRKLTKLITWITALSNSVKLWAMPCRVTPNGRSWWRLLTKCGPLEKAMANHISTLALKTPWTVCKGKNIKTLKDELPRSVGVQQFPREEWRDNSRKNEEAEAKYKEHSVVGVTSDRSEVWCNSKKIKRKHEYCLWS